MTVTFKTKFGGGYLAEPTFESMFFPGGEAHIKVVNEREGVGPLTQYARIDSADGNDLMILAMWAMACHKRGEITILEIPYLPGARADHHEELVFGSAVYADLINSMGLDKVVCFDPHSRIMPEMIRNLEIRDSAALVREHIVGHADRGGPQRYQGIIAPDKGARERAMRVALACHLPIYYAEKHRDKPTGKLSHFTCEPLPDEGKFLVVDDICDGGGTFMGLAEATGLERERLGLYVSHGVFSGMAYKLFDYFDEIWTTDSLDTCTNIDNKYDATADSHGIKDVVSQHLGLRKPNRVNIIPLNRILEGYSA